MLHIAPQLVRMDAAQPRANVPTFDWAEGDLLRSPRAALFRTMKQMTPHGAYGEPARPPPRRASRSSAIVCDALDKILADLVQKP